MFTGIIQTIGQVIQASDHTGGRRLFIEPQSWPVDYVPGESIAVNGCCLTHHPDAQSKHYMAFDVVQETLEKTNIGQLKNGSHVNLESSLKIGDSLSGHFVQGHIDAVGKVSKIDSSEKGWWIDIQFDAEILPYIVPKGSVTLNGISLTIAAVDQGKHTLTVAIIPATLELTTLGKASVGDVINIETDILTRTVVHWLQLPGNADASPSLTMDKLRNLGFAE